MFNYERVISAKERIKDYVYCTPLEQSLFFSNEETKVFLKLECQQKTKSFKIRGALSKMTLLSEEEKSRGVMAISSGNHGAAVSYAANLLGIENTIVFVPTVTPQSKIDKIKYYGAEIKIVGNNFDETRAIGMGYLEKNKLTFIDPYYEDIDVIAGQGTVAIEILQQNPDIDTILVPVSGGGLVTGVGVAAKHLKPSIKIIGLQTSSCPAMVQSLKDKVMYEEYPPKPSICEALIGGVGLVPYKMAEQCIDDVLEVDEDTIKKATAILMRKEKIIAEPSSAIGIAAIMKNPSLVKGKNAAVVISGGNIDEKFMKYVLYEE